MLKNKLKLRLAALGLAALSIFSFVGCKGQDQSQENSLPDTEQSIVDSSVDESISSSDMSSSDSSSEENSSDKPVETIVEFDENDKEEAYQLFLNARSALFNKENLKIKNEIWFPGDENLSREEGEAFFYKQNGEDIWGSCGNGHAGEVSAIGYKKNDKIVNGSISNGLEKQVYFDESFEKLYSMDHPFSEALGLSSFGIDSENLIKIEKFSNGNIKYTYKEGVTSESYCMVERIFDDSNNFVSIKTYELKSDGSFEEGIPVCEWEYIDQGVSKTEIDKTNALKEIIDEFVDEIAKNVELSIDYIYFNDYYQGWINSEPYSYTDTEGPLYIGNDNSSDVQPENE